MGSLPSVKQQIFPTGTASKPALASLVKGLEIHARWNGVQEHPATISMRITIEAQPSTYLQLFKVKDPLILSYAVRSVVTSTELYEDIPYEQAADLTELQGDTLTASEAENFMHTVVRKVRLRNESVETLPLQVLPSLALDGQASPLIPKDDHMFKSVPSDIQEVGDAPVIDSMTAVRVISSAPGTPRTLVGNENRPPLAVVKAPLSSQSLPSTQYLDCQARLMLQPRPLSTAGHDRPMLSPRKLKIRSKRAQLGGLTMHEDPPHQTPTHKPRKAVTLPRPSRALKHSAARDCHTASQPLSQARETSRYYGTLPLFRPAKANGLPSKSDRDVDDPYFGATTLWNMPYRDFLLPKTALPSPFETPRVWINGTEHGNCTSPSTVVLRDVLYVYFPSEMCPDSYEIEIDLIVLLSEPDFLGWQTFKVPGLLTEPLSDVRGIAQFQAMPHSKDHHSITPVQFDYRGFSVIQEVQQGHFKGEFPISEPFSLRLRLAIEVKHIKEWTSNVLIYSTVFCDDGRGMCMKYCVNLTVATTKDDTFARRARFSVLIRNGPPAGGVYRLQSGEEIIELSSYEYTVTDFERTVEIWIERDSQDMDKPLKLGFTCLYPGIEEASILLPVIFPKSGKVLSEKIWLFKPLPPLMLHPVIRNFLSEQLFGKQEVYCFDRKEMPPRYPTALSDDVVVRLRNLKPIFFVGLEVPGNPEWVKKCSNTIPLLRYVVNTIPENRLECRMSFDLEVGTQQHQLKIEAPEWVPIYCLINDRMCSQEQPCWWEEDNLLCLFKMPWMSSGDLLHIKMAFIMIGRIDDFATRKDQFIKVNGTLPRITDKVVFGGDLVCNINDAVVTLVFNKDNNLGNEDIPFSTRYGGNSKRLPLLQPGHKFEIMFKMLNLIWQKPSRTPRPSVKAGRIRFSEGLPLQPRTLRFDDETSDASSSSTDNFDEEPNSPDLCAAKSDIRKDEKISKSSNTQLQGVKADTGDGASDVSSSSSPDEGDDILDEDDLDEEDEVPSIMLSFWLGILRALETLVGLVDMAEAAYLYLNLRSPMRSLMRVLVVGLIWFVIHDPIGMNPTSRGIPSVGAPGFTSNDANLNSDVASLPALQEKKVIEVDAKVMAPQQPRRSVRDKIDMAMGWRPMP
ncbi:MAG: hypothetical protein Q9209_004886 [Squamulea sp. 1 TL-2023]